MDSAAGARPAVACTLECEAPFPRLGHEGEAHLFRIAQEAVNNAVTRVLADMLDLPQPGPAPEATW